MSSEKKDYPGVGAPTAQHYQAMPASAAAAAAAAAHPATMTSPYAGYPTTAFTSPGYLPSAPTYLPASYGSPIGPPLPYGAVSVTPSVTYGVPPSYLPPVTPMYSPRPATVYLPAGYDAGARFDGHGMPVVPPPPPGLSPNAAQLAMMQGNSVVLGQQKSSYLSGGSSGGYTFW